MVGGYNRETTVHLVASMLLLGGAAYSWLWLLVIRHCK